MRTLWFWLRWSGRDLRRRWIQVTIIALVIAIGTGSYAGLLSLNTWQSLSLDESYEILNAHDIRVELPDSSFADSGALKDALSEMDDQGRIASAEERLIVPVQIDASVVAEETVLVPGRIVAMPEPSGDRQINDIYLTGGRGLEYGTVLEGHFSKHYDLPDEGRLELPGGVFVDYVGTGFTPEYFLVLTGQGDFMAEANFAVLFMSLSEAQKLTNREGKVNDMVIELSEGEDRQTAAEDVERVLKSQMPDIGISVSTIEEDDVYIMLYEDAEADRAVFNMLAILILIAAALAAFNLISRIVEAQRREIGVSMALGVKPRMIALRPLLTGAEIAGLGVVFGVGIGFVIALMLKSVFEEIFPLPVWVTPMQSGVFLAGAAIGFLIPFIATAWPVIRAVRVNPVQAIKTGHLAAKGGGLAPLLKKLPIPGGSFGQMPIRNLFRAPRRTFLTVLGVGATLVVMVAILGVVDSFQEVLKRGSDEIERGATDRLSAKFVEFEEVDSEIVRNIGKSDAVSEIEPVLTVFAQVLGVEETINIQIQALDLESDIWHPTVFDAYDEGTLPKVILSEKAADDAGVKTGESVSIIHPFMTPKGTLTLRESEMVVAGIHPNPLRFFAYMDTADASVLGLEGFTNEIQVVPSSGTSKDELKRALFGMPGVAVIEEPGVGLELTSELLDEFSGIFKVFALFSLILALLIAFNVASINADERAREYATMAAYGVRVRTMMRMSVIEVGLIGFMGTLIGIAFGLMALSGLLAINQSAMPELQMVSKISWGTIAATMFFGVVVVGLAPIFTTRKLRRMNIPSTLRVME